ncbi:hypothetical protein D3C86_2080210 [compost metagenome]
MREALVRERTQASNQAHGFLLELGISLPKGVATMKCVWTPPQGLAGLHHGVPLIQNQSRGFALELG